jgi:integrase
VQGRSPRRRCIYAPHSLRPTTATLLLDGDNNMAEVQDLLGHRHITTTQIYDRRWRADSIGLLWMGVFVLSGSLIMLGTGLIRAQG